MLWICSEADGCAAVLDGETSLLHGVVESGTGEITVGISGFEADGCLGIFDGFFVFPAFLVYTAARQVVACVGGEELYEGFGLFQGFARASVFDAQDGESEPSVFVHRIDFEQMPVVGVCFLVVSCCGMDVGPEEEGFLVVGIGGEDSVEVCKGLGMIVSLQVEGCPRQEEGGGGGVEV